MSPNDTARARTHAVCNTRHVTSTQRNTQLKGLLSIALQQLERNLTRMLAAHKNTDQTILSFLPCIKAFSIEANLDPIVVFIWCSSVFRACVSDFRACDSACASAFILRTSDFRASNSAFVSACNSRHAVRKNV